MCVASVSSGCNTHHEALLAVRDERPIIFEIQNIPPSFMMRVHEKSETALATRPDNFEGLENEVIKGEVCRQFERRTFITMAIKEDKPVTAKTQN